LLWNGLHPAHIAPQVNKTKQHNAQQTTRKSQKDKEKSSLNNKKTFKTSKK
jgi:hypothetical protein